MNLTAVEDKEMSLKPLVERTLERDNYRVEDGRKTTLVANPGELYLAQNTIDYANDAELGHIGNLPRPIGEMNTSRLNLEYIDRPSRVQRGVDQLKSPLKQGPTINDVPATQAFDTVIGAFATDFDKSVSEQYGQPRPIAEEISGYIGGDRSSKKFDEQRERTYRKPAFGTLTLQNYHADEEPVSVRFLAVDASGKELSEPFHEQYQSSEGHKKTCEERVSAGKFANPLGASQGNNTASPDSLPGTNRSNEVETPASAIGIPYQMNSPFQSMIWMCLTEIYRTKDSSKNL